MKDGVLVTVDGASDEPAVLVEAWAHQGAAQGGPEGQGRRRPLQAAVAGSHAVRGQARKILTLSDGTAAGHFRGRSWIARALRDLEIEETVVSLPEAVRERVRRAQERQFR
jgi:hypothetical protein